MSYLKLFKYLGLKLDYSNTWKDKIMNCYAIFVQISLAIAFSIKLYFLIFSDKNLEQFVEGFAPAFINFEAILKCFVFYTRRNDISQLTLRLKSFLFDCNDEKLPKFEILIKNCWKVYDILLKLSFLSALATQSRTLYINFNGKRMLPYKAE